MILNENQLPNKMTLQDNQTQNFLEISQKELLEEPKELSFNNKESIIKEENEKKEKKESIFLKKQKTNQMKNTQKSPIKNENLKSRTKSVNFNLHNNEKNQKSAIKFSAEIKEMMTNVQNKIEKVEESRKKNNEKPTENAPYITEKNIAKVEQLTTKTTENTNKNTEENVGNDSLYVEVLENKQWFIDELGRIRRNTSFMKRKKTEESPIKADLEKQEEYLRRMELEKEERLKKLGQSKEENEKTAEKKKASTLEEDDTAYKNSKNLSLSHQINAISKEFDLKMMNWKEKAKDFDVKKLDYDSQQINEYCSFLFY